MIPAPPTPLRQAPPDEGNAALSPEPRRRRLDRLTLGREVGAVLLAALALLVAIGAILGYGAARQAAYGEMRATVTTATTLLAQDEAVLAGVRADDPAAALAARADAARVAAGLDWVVVMDLDGTRWTHPDPERIGGQYLGHIEEARDGGIVVEEYEGTLGPSLRAVRPVLDEDGQVVALVAAGIRISAIHASVTPRLLALVAVSATALLLGMGAAWWVRGRLDREAGGLGRHAILRTLAQHEALLRSVRAGYVLVDPDGRVELCNDEARDLLGLEGEVSGVPIKELGLEPGLADLMASGRESEAEIHVAHDRDIVVAQVPEVHGRQRLGWVTTLADHTEMIRMTGVVSSQQTLIDALRARAHEADNRLHTIVVLVELGEYERAVEFATNTLRDAHASAERLQEAVHEPALVALLAGKASQAQERGVELRLDRLVVPATGMPAEDLVVIVGNLVDNAIDAAAEGEEPRWVELRGRRAGPGEGPWPEGVWPGGARPALGAPSEQFLLEVADSGPGLPEELVEQAFTRGWSSKPPRPDSEGWRGLGLTLVRTAVARLGGSIDVRREHGATFTVALPLGSAVEATCSPADAPKEVSG
ncbi:sensor histidine kinase [Bogoriella caseilytica]|uniref:histidine kinase n=1 Tax=Bogoriella caseilytica TaxID=56055 RepID=A0A3N2BA66_9MICO|nr:ATP-binding protein [Bogoriella caseilytica]ROR71974.1 two-component system CitB family sensor kinase [Bogoriella caseilytica]